MRLLNAERDRMRHAVLDDVPKVNYDTLIVAKAMSLAFDKLPPKARELWNNPSTRGLLATHSCYFGYQENRRHYAASASLPGYEEFHAGFKEDPEIVELIAKAFAQADKRTELDRELRVNFAAVGTHEEFAKRWPELKKYLPDGSEAKSENLPATTALLDGLKAAGLPLDTEAEPA